MSQTTRVIAAAMVVLWAGAAGAADADKAAAMKAGEILAKMKSVYQGAKSLSAEGGSVTLRSSSDPNMKGRMQSDMTADFSVRLKRPELYIVKYGAEPKGAGHTIRGCVFNDGTGNWLEVEGQKKMSRPNRQSAIKAGATFSGLASAVMPSLFFGEDWGGMPQATASRGADETAGGEECFVVSDVVTDANRASDIVTRMWRAEKITVKLWVSKKTYLLTQYETNAVGLGVVEEEIDRMAAKLNEGRQASPPVDAAKWKEGMKEAAKEMAGASVVITTTIRDTMLDASIPDAEFTPKEDAPAGAKDIGKEK